MAGSHLWLFLSKNHLLFVGHLFFLAKGYAPVGLANLKLLLYCVGFLFEKVQKGEKY
jgi:hypothetical protein